MNIKDFIIYNLEKISNAVDTEFIYSFNSETDTHIIFMSPSEFRIDNDLYINFEYDLWKAIFRNYPNDDILITDDYQYVINDNNTIVITNN